MEIDRSKLKLLADDGHTIRHGWNVGRYPLQDFVYNMYRGKKPLLTIDHAGHDSWIGGCIRTKKNAVNMSVELICDGHMTFAQNGSSHYLKQGDVFVVQPGGNSEMYVSGNDCAEKQMVVISGMLLDDIRYMGMIHTKNVLIGKDTGVLKSMLLEAYDLLKKKPGNMQMELAVLAFRIVSELCALFNEKPVDARFVQICEYMDNNVHRTLSLEEMSAHAGCSMTSLNRLFNKHTDMSPMNFFIKKKMRIASRMLLESDAQVKQIAYDLGYTDSLYFAREFRKHFGVSPKAYRRVHIQEKSDTN